MHATRPRGWTWRLAAAAAGETDFPRMRAALSTAWPLGPHDVPRLFAAGYTTEQIAPQVGLGVRRVQQIVAEAGLRPAALPVPSAARLDKIIETEVARHGGGYGYGYLQGALRAHHPELRLPRRRVLEALQRLFPAQLAPIGALRARRACASWCACAICAGPRRRQQLRAHKSWRWCPRDAPGWARVPAGIDVEVR